MTGYKEKITEEVGAPETGQVPCWSSSHLSCLNLCGTMLHLPEDAMKLHDRPFKPVLLLVKGKWQLNLELGLEERRGEREIIQLKDETISN